MCRHLPILAQVNGKVVHQEAPLHLKTLEHRHGWVNAGSPKSLLHVDAASIMKVQLRKVRLDGETWTRFNGYNATLGPLVDLLTPGAEALEAWISICDDSCQLYDRQDDCS